MTNAPEELRLIGATLVDVGANLLRAADSIESVDPAKRSQAGAEIVMCLGKFVSLLTTLDRLTPSLASEASEAARAVTEEFDVKNAQSNQVQPNSGALTADELTQLLRM